VKILLFPGFRLFPCFLPERLGPEREVACVEPGVAVVSAALCHPIVPMGTQNMFHHGVRHEFPGRRPALQFRFPDMIPTWEALEAGRD